jgi:hypothetical protein
VVQFAVYEFMCGSQWYAVKASGMSFICCRAHGWQLVRRISLQKAIVVPLDCCLYRAWGWQLDSWRLSSEASSAACLLLVQGLWLTWDTQCVCRVLADMQELHVCELLH